jgi:hypothetical protein
MRDDALVLHHAHLPDDDVVERTGSTSRARCVRSSTSPPSPDDDQLTRLIDDAHDRGLLTLQQLRSRSEAIDPLAAVRIERAIQAAGPS